jgi:hypothetical protein
LIWYSWRDFFTISHPSEWYNRNIVGHNTLDYITYMILTSWYSHRSDENTLKYYYDMITTQH